MKNTKIIFIVRHWRICLLLMLVLSKAEGLVICSAAKAQQATQEQLVSAERAVAGLAKHILDTTGIKGGLVVHIGCSDGRLTAALRANDSYIVHGLDKDAQDINQARKYIHSLGLEGPVSVDTFDGKQLPYIDNLVNLVVAEALDDVPMAEVMRVLAPQGVAYIQRDGKWTRTVKSRPKDIDQWTHFLHGPDGNAVAQDDIVGFPYHIQWIGSPIHSRDHELATSMDVMVSAGGRIFYIIDEGPTAIPHYLPSRWYLVARDAFNGVVLWKCPLSIWRPYLVHGRTSLAADMWRRLVATENEIYVTTTIFGKVSALEPGTGQIIRTYEETEKTEEIIFEGSREAGSQNGILYLVASTAEPEQIDRRQLATMRVEPDKKRIIAVKADTGKLLWTKEDEDTTGVHPLTLAVKDKRLFFQNASAVICLEAETGTCLWRYSRPSIYSRPGHATPTLVVYDDVVLSADRINKQAAKLALSKVEGKKNAGKAKSADSELIALSAKTGNELWRCECGENVGAGVDIFVANGLVWIGENPRRAASDYNHGRDLHTGEIKKSFSHEQDWPTWHHHRCYRDKATEKYILAGRTGIEFVDLETGELTTHHWIRGICEYGIMPCNGLIYSPPDQCACYIESRLQGFHALAPKRQRSEDRIQTLERLEKGPAYGEIRATSDEQRATDDWPTFRHDNSRSGYTRCELPLTLKSAWNTEIGGKLTSLVCAQDRLYVAQPETHTVFCLNSDTGRTLWSYQTGGRIDSPPSISNGIAVFGCGDGWVYALRASDGQLVWRFRAAPEDLRLVEDGQVASVWPVHGSVLIDKASIYFAAGRSSYIDGGMYLYKLELETGKVLLQKNYYGRDPETEKRVSLYTPYDGELLPDRELPGLLPDILSWDGKNLYMRAVPLSRDFVIQDKEYVPHLFCSMGFLEDTWWERTYWIYGSHFYSGARGHAYARTLFPGGRILTFDEQSVYGYQDLTLNEKNPGIFRVAKSPEFKDWVSRIKLGQKKQAQIHVDKQDIERKFVWKNGVPQNPQQMNLISSRNDLADAIRTVVKYEYTWQKDVPLYGQAMVLANKTFFIAGPARFNEQETQQYLVTARTDSFQLNPLLKDALDTFEGRKDSLLLATDKVTGQMLAEFKLPSSPVFDGMIAANGRLFLALKNGCVVCFEAK